MHAKSHGGAARKFFPPYGWIGQAFVDLGRVY